MITKDNFKDVLLSIGFEKSLGGDSYSKQFSTYAVAVDFENEELKYPTSKGLIVNDKTTSNFSHNENFVVFECVCRLLDKGYRPEHIELEPKWQLGRDAKSGKADIVVKDEKGDVLIIIECKTAGIEYNKEVKNTEDYGGQLFSYWQQENATRWLALYASDWKDGQVQVKSQVINCTDDQNILAMAKKDKDVLTYANAKNDAERFAVWDETYNKTWLDNLIFNEESQAYNIGIQPLRKKNLRAFTKEDKIVNRFEEILRHNNVSDKENAFNRLVALFICKLVDEIKKQDFDEVEFQYKQGTDTYESLQDRLQRLHKQGMEEFMKEKIFYVEANYAERLFKQYTGSQRKRAIDDLNNTIRILKFYSNNDFAFKDVHNEELFFQNGKILVEVVQLFQPFQIVYTTKQQFLGDLFEQLLNKGFKQNEGQFFTPTPITRFIWDSLPLQTYISDHGLPNVIDYACGAGHFLTEAIEAINAVRMNEENSWVEKHIFGVEKDYRLARVSKISLFMNGAGGAKIIFGDGLENYMDKGIENGAFDILVANPPYSVSGFKQHLKLRNNSFRLFDIITNDGKEIETLFVERIAQLLRPQGLAAVVLPTSILSNSSNSYIAAREELLQNFYVHAIVSFGSKTFGATGTNTVTLFLERFNEPPRIAELTKDSVDAIMTGEDLTNFTDKQLLADYLAMQKVSENDYTSFVCKDMDGETIHMHDYFKVYADAFSNMSINLPKKCSAEEEERIRREKFYDIALAVEREKLYYFALVREQQTLVITAPSDNNEQKAFLGYDWSNRKGAEGIVINTPGGKLYDPDSRFSRGTLACAVRNSFAGAQTQLSDDLMKYAKTYWLKDMIDWSRSEFNKEIKIVAKKHLEVHSKYPLLKLGAIADIQKGKSITAAQCKDGVVKVVAGGRDYAYLHNEANRPANVITVSASGAYAGYVNFWSEPIFASDCNTIFTDDKITTLFIYNYLASIQDYIYSLQSGAAQPHVYADDLANIPIPDIKKDLQLQIVKECKAIDDEYNTSRMTIETYRKKIQDIFEELEVVNKSKLGGGKYKLSDSNIFNISIGKRVLAKELVENGSYPVYSANVNEPFGTSDRSIIGSFETSSILWGIDGDWMTNYIPSGKPFMPTDHCGVLRTKDERINVKYLEHVLYKEGLRLKFSRSYRASIDRIKGLTVTLPSIDVQNKAISKVEEYEQTILNAQQVMALCTARKRAVLEKYLN